MSRITNCAIKGVPNDDRGHQMIKSFKRAQVHVRKRGKGPREHDGVKYHNSLPLRFATHYTAYFETPGELRVPMYKWAPRVYWKLLKVSGVKGKPHLKLARG